MLNFIQLLVRPSLNGYFCHMKFLSSLLIVLFITFLSTPTVVTLIKKQTDVSVFYSFSEEEIHKNMKEDTHFVFYDWNQPKNSKIVFENLSKHDNVFATIFSPPPELV